MQKWEYMVLGIEGTVGPGLIHTGCPVVWSINDQFIKKISLLDLLTKFGDEGWEVVSAAGTDNRTGFVILKRPK